MFTDAQATFATAHSATAATSTNISTNVYDLGPLASSPVANLIRDIGVGASQKYVRITCTATATSSDSATVDFRLVTDSASAMAGPVTIASTGAIAKATLVDGWFTDLAIPPGAYQRFIAMNAHVGVTILTAGTFAYHIVTGRSDRRHYAPGVSIDV